MPIESPQLDDLSYDDLVALLKNQIPHVAPEWTDHNASDPGITLIELFGLLGEQLGYRLNQVPEKNYVEFLKLIGIKLQPAEAAKTLLSFYWSKAETAKASTLRAGARVQGKAADGAPAIFETDTDTELVPAQLAALVTTRSSELRQITPSGEAPPVDSDTAQSFIPDRFSLPWNGKRPKIDKLPTEPVALFQKPSEATHSNLWVALAFNPSPADGFLGQRVSWHLQLDDDEQPLSTSMVECGDTEVELVSVADPDAPLALYQYYRPPQAGEAKGSWRDLSVLSDTTQGWTRSGVVRFDVPHLMGPVPDGEWEDARPKHALTTVDVCEAASGTGDPIPEKIAHPLIGAIRTPVDGMPSEVPISGWLRVSFSTVVPQFSLRALSFNVAAATNAQRVRGEILGRGNGRPGQIHSLVNPNVLSDSIEIEVEDATSTLLHPWTQVDSFDMSGPQSRHYVLDAEAGLVAFGDGLRGKPPEIRMRIVATEYRHGGGVGAELPVGAINAPDSLPSAMSSAVNLIAARGGKDAETLDEAKQRAPQHFKTRDRAVTAEDFVHIAKAAPGVRVNRAEVIPLRVPYAAASARAPGVDMETVAPGALTIVIVPDQDGAHPTPTAGELRTVCDHLDDYRLVTTEVHIAPPMYVRLFNVSAIVRADPGFGRSLLRESIANHLSTYFHVLRGGPDGTGFPLGSTVHHADLLAQIFQVEGVARVSEVSAFYDGHSENLEGVAPMSWRPERATARRLIGCVETPNDDEEIVLAADECVFVDTATLTVIVR